MKPNSEVCVSFEDRGSTPLASTMLISSYLYGDFSSDRNLSRNKAAEIRGRLPVSRRLNFRYARAIVVTKAWPSQNRSRKPRYHRSLPSALAFKEFGAAS